jgi:hypothetical protein
VFSARERRIWEGRGSHLGTRGWIGDLGAYRSGRERCQSEVEEEIHKMMIIERWEERRKVEEKKDNRRKQRTGLT